MSVQSKRIRSSTILLVILLFVLLVMTTIILSFSGKGNSAQKDTSSERQIPVVLTPAIKRNFEERLVIQGTLESQNYAMVSARLPGTIESIFVNEGDNVVAGKSKLFLIDSLNLQKEVDIRKQDISLCSYKRKEKEANLEQIEADFHKTTLDYERFQRLYQKKAVTPDEMEQQESRYKQAEAVRKHAQALVDLSIEEERQSKVRLEMAEKNLRDALTYAPISGKISSKLREPGEMAQPGQPIVRIDNPSVIEISAYLPGQYYDRVVVDKTLMRIKIYNLTLPEQVITYKSPVIQPKLRTFEVKSILKNPPEIAVPGALAEIEIILASSSNIGIPSEAIQIRNGRSIIFEIKNNTASMLEVETGLETDGYIELKGNKLQEGDSIVTMGQSLLDEGSPVTIIQKESK